VASGAFDLPRFAFLDSWIRVPFSTFLVFISTLKHPA